MIEQWAFKVKKTTLIDSKNETTNIIVSNMRTAKWQNLPYYLKEHENSLNINISHAFVETVLETK